MSTGGVGIPVQPFERGLSDDRGEARRAAGARSLTRLAMTGTAWTLLGHAGAQVMRIGSHLVLAWLLDPAVFGVMVMVDVVLQGLKMVSDVGTGPSIVQHERGDDPDFLDTAWTVQVMRHGGLFVLACLMAWPVAMYRGQDQLMILLPVAAISALLGGLRSTAPATLHRHLELRTLTLFELSMQVIRSGTTIALAFYLRNVWALVLGAIAGSAVTLIASHTVIAKRRNRFCWDRDAVGHLFRFGRWIFIATGLTFVCSQGDKLILAGFLSDGQLGLYGIAVLLAMAVPQALREVTNRVLFPVYSRIARQPAHLLRGKIMRSRLLLQLATVPVLCVLAIGGREIVTLLYPERYHGVAWMLQLLAMGAVFRVVELTMSPVLLASGDSFRHMLALVSQSVLMVAAMVIGGATEGLFGLVAGIAIAPVLNYPVLAWAVKRYGVWMPWFDAAFMLAAAMSITAGTVWLS